MSSRKQVRQKLTAFKRLSKRSLKCQKQKLNNCPDEVICDLVALIREICFNPDLKFNKKQLKKIKKFKKFMRNVANKKTPSKRKYIVKHLKGGFLSALLPLLVSIASSAVPVITKLIG